MPFPDVGGGTAHPWHGEGMSDPDRRDERECVLGRCGRQGIVDNGMEMRYNGAAK